MPLSLRQIRYFIAVAEAGQVSKAAIDLNVSQSAVTTAIRNLEDLLGVRLFRRHSSGVTMTYEGHKFLQHAKHITSSVEEAMRISNRARNDVSGTISIAATYTVAGYFLPTHIAHFRRAFSNIEVAICEMDRAKIEEGLIDDTYDVSVLLTSNLINQEHIDAFTLLRSRRRVWLCADHRLLQNSAISLQDIAQEPYLMLTIDEASNTAQKYWNRTPYLPNIFFRTLSIEAVRSMVANGTGVTILSDMVYRPWSLDGLRIEVREVSDRVPYMDVGLAWRRGKHHNPATAAFIEFMKLAFSETYQYLPNHPAE